MTLLPFYSSIMMLLNGVFLASWSRWVFMVSVTGTANITGGMLCFVMMKYAFIADNSSPRTRTIRIGIISGCWYVPSIQFLVE